MDKIEKLRIIIEEKLEELESETKNRYKNDLEEGRYNALIEVIDMIDEI